MHRETGENLRVEERGLLGHDLARLGHRAHHRRRGRIHEEERRAAAVLPALAAAKLGECCARVLRVPEVGLRRLRLLGQPDDVLEQTAVEERDIGAAQLRLSGPKVGCAASEATVAFRASKLALPSG